MKTFYRFALFSNAFLFMNILFVSKEIYLYFSSEPHKNAYTISGIAFITFCAIIGLIGFIFVFCKTNSTFRTYKVLNKHNETGTYYFGYFSLFVLLFLSFDLNNLLNLLIYIALYLGLAVVYCRNDLFYINPTILLVGKRLYNVQVEKSKDKTEDVIVISSDPIYTGSSYKFYSSSYEFTVCEKLDDSDN